MKNKEFRIGLFATSTLVLLYFGFNFLKGIDFFDSTEKYYAIYDNVDQLTPSNPVLLSGTSVGRVSKITILQARQNKVLVEFEIDSKIKLGDSTKAILDSDFLGTKSIRLSIGRSFNFLKPRDTVRSEVAKGLTDILTESAVPVADNLQVTLRKFNTVIDNLVANSQQLDAIFQKLNSTPDKLNATLDNANGQITELSSSVKSVAGNLNVVLTDLRPALANFKTLSDSLKRLQLNQTIAKTQQTLTRLNETLGKLSKGDNTMSKLMTEDSLYVNLNRLIRSLDSLANHFNNNPKHFMAPLGKSKKRIERDRRREEEDRAKKD